MSKFPGLIDRKYKDEVSHACDYPRPSRPAWSVEW